MRRDLQIFIDHQPNGRDFARSMFTRERVVARVAAAKEALAHDVFDLNPHLQIITVADLVLSDLKAEGFDETTREEVYLCWLTLKTFNPEALVP